jgi:hypothetical protein
MRPAQRVSADVAQKPWRLELIRVGQAWSEVETWGRRPDLVVRGKEPAIDVTDDLRRSN